MWWAHPTAQALSLCFGLVEREFSTKWKLLSQKQHILHPFPVQRTWGGKKITFLDKKRKKILWHLAIRGVYCAKPQIFWTSTEAWKHFWKKLESLPKKKLVRYCFFFSLGLCTLDVLIFQISLKDDHVSPKPSSQWSLRRKILKEKAQVWVLLRVVLCCSDSSAHSGLGYFCFRRKLNE